MRAPIGIYSEDLADQILEHIADGGTIASASQGADGEAVRSLPVLVLV